MENINDIDKLKKNFILIIDLVNSFNKKKINVQKKLEELKILYKDIIKKNNKKIFLFCLDSFLFQYKSYQMDMEHIEKKRLTCLNRIYCDYYKLYQLMVKYLQENEQTLYENQLEKQTFPIYKDLEPFHEYSLKDIIGIHEIILSTIKTLFEKYEKKQDLIDHYYETHKVGFSISNFLNTLKHENRLLQDQIDLYVNYISFFHISQKKQLKVLQEKMNYFEKEMDENISMNHTFSIEDIDEKETQEIEESIESLSKTLETEKETDKETDKENITLELPKKEVKEEVKKEVKKEVKEEVKKEVKENPAPVVQTPRKKASMNMGI